MTQAQVRSRGSRVGRRYESLLIERIRLGRQLADALSHLQELEPLSRHIFNCLLRLAAQLAAFKRYDRDVFRVLAEEDERLHPPGGPGRPPDGAVFALSAREPAARS